jgi:HEAT repeat protein
MNFIENNKPDINTKDEVNTRDILKHFSSVADKQQAWNDLHKLTTDENPYVRLQAAYAIGYACSQLPDKQQACDDLHRLTTDENSEVRTGAYYALGYTYSKLPDEQKPWACLQDRADE